MEIEKVDKEESDLLLLSGGMKKQVIRRRLHSNKPYQERLLNMAEARREIATALKFHRASMNQQEAGAGVNHHQQQQQQGTSTSNNNYYPISTIIVPPPPLPLHHENLNLALPNQTLGLNLNFQDFNDLNTSVYHSTANSSGGVAVESDEMKEIRSLNRVCKSIKTTEIGPADDDGYHPFEQVMEFPPWLINANESSCLHDHHFSDDYYSPDPALAWMDIGEIEGMDGEWLA
ncbi:hypothetical protein L6452_03382 [Arctium lappa]|uniref:Uncharacterized protein n=1 Tax=Arctium lappa TaxID=4217 RepID=A0ACB9FN01_ARCLA|nr:hypothetical protein L6452_03382 [Arctium lappa]